MTLTLKARRRAEMGTNRFSSRYNTPMVAPKPKTVEVPCAKLGCTNFARVPTYYEINALRRFYCSTHKRPKTTRSEI